MVIAAVRGAEADDTTAPRSKEEARANAVAAYGAARAKAEREMGNLLALLRAAAPPLTVEPSARTAMEAVGMLWETAARLNEP